MVTFFATFMQRQAFKSHYVEIKVTEANCTNNRDEISSAEALARSCMFYHFGGQFMTVYPEEGFDAQITEYGLERLCTIEVTDHHSSIEYKIG